MYTQYVFLVFGILFKFLFLNVVATVWRAISLLKYDILIVLYAVQICWFKLG